MILDSCAAAALLVFIKNWQITSLSPSVMVTMARNCARYELHPGLAVEKSTLCKLQIVAFGVTGQEYRSPSYALPAQVVHD